MKVTDEERKERKREYDRRRYEANPERAKRQNAAWLAANPERAADTHRRWHKRNREKMLGLMAKRYKAHREEELKRMAERYRTHRAEDNAGSARWKADNREKALEAIRRWSHEHPEERRVLEEKRRSLKYSNTPIEEMLTSTEWLAILAEHNGHCHYCGKEAKLTLDHVVPLSKGGKHSKDNVVPACGHCNSSKGTKTLEEWNAKRLTQVKQ